MSVISLFPKMRMSITSRRTVVLVTFVILVSGRPTVAQLDTNPGKRMMTSDYLFRKSNSDSNHINELGENHQFKTGNNYLVSELVPLVTRLQDRVAQLERQMAEDRTLLKLLQQQQQQQSNPVVVQGSETRRQPDVVKRLETQLTSLKSDLSELVASKERDAERSEDIRELRLEFDGVHSECQKMRMEVQGLKDRREEDSKRYGQQRNNQMTIKWLQKTMQEVRKEMTELAAVQNVSAAIRQQQQYETGLSLLRSDVVAMRTQLEEVRVSQDRDQAILNQVQQDVQDHIRNQHHTIAANAQLFREELSQFKDELQALAATTNSMQPLQGFSGQGKNSEGQQQQQVSSTGVTNLLLKNGDLDKPIKKMTKKTIATVGDISKHPNDVIQVDLGTFFSPQTHHRLRHHGKLREEFQKLKSVVQLLYQRQTEMDGRVNTLRRNQTTTEGDVRHLWGRMADVLNSTRFNDVKRVSLERSISDLQKSIQGFEQRLVNDDKVLHDLSDSVAGIDKLHSSTVQLFESLEALEDEYGKRIDDLRIEVSKFEFNMGQLTSSVDLLKEDQRNHYDALKAVRSDVSGLHQDVEKTEYKLADLRSEVVMDEARRILDARLSDNSPTTNDSQSKAPERNALLELESRVSSLGNQFLQQSLQYNDVLDKLSHKADLKHVAHWATSADQLNDAVANLTQQIDTQKVKITAMEDDIHKMHQHFPSDCSQVTGPTGIYQLYLWNASSLVTAFCDMDTDGGSWTTIQQRRGGSTAVDFDRDWNEYKAGFGRVDAIGDFWIGNDLLHHLTTPTSVQLRIDAWDIDGRYHYVQYDAFQVADEHHGYALHLGERVGGNASDALRYHNGMKFSTRDVDNDFSSQNCAREYEGGWWYNHCQHVNINGKYTIGLSWYDEDNNTLIQIQRTEMKIRPSKSIKS